MQEREKVLLSDTDKYLSYGGLVMAKSGRLELGNNILPTL